MLTRGPHPSQARPNIWNLKLRPSAKKPPPSPLINYRSIIIPRLAHLTITHDAPVFAIVLHFDKDHQHTLHISEPFEYACILLDRPCLAKLVIVVRILDAAKEKDKCMMLWTSPHIPPRHSGKLIRQRKWARSNLTWPWRQLQGVGSVCVCWWGNTVPVASVIYRLAMKGINQVVSTSSSEILKAKIGKALTKFW